MRHPLRRAIVGAAGLLAALCCAAAPQRLDDSSSPRQRVPAQLVLSDSGRPLAQDDAARHALVRFGPVRYRLATAAFVGRRARIDFVLPAIVSGLRSPDALLVEWRGDGRFASGSGRSGERRAVWTGVIAEPWLDAVLDLTARVSLDDVRLQRDGTFGFEGHFEIEVLP